MIDTWGVQISGDESTAIAGNATVHAYGTGWTSEKDCRTQCLFSYISCLQTISPSQLLPFPELCGNTHCAQKKS